MVNPLTFCNSVVQLSGKPEGIKRATPNYGNCFSGVSATGWKTVGVVRIAFKVGRCKEGFNCAVHETMPMIKIPITATKVFSGNFNRLILR